MVDQRAGHVHRRWGITLAGGGALALVPWTVCIPLAGILCYLGHRTFDGAVPPGPWDLPSRD